MQVMESNGQSAGTIRRKISAFAPGSLRRSCLVDLMRCPARREKGAAAGRSATPTTLRPVSTSASFEGQSATRNLLADPTAPSTGAARPFGIGFGKRLNFPMNLLNKPSPIRFSSRPEMSQQSPWVHTVSVKNRLGGAPAALSPLASQKRPLLLPGGRFL
jgi:hypothetical protein